MVVSFCLLILLLLPGALLAADAPPPVENQCLHCHPVHYPELGSCTDCHGGITTTQRREIAHHGLIAARYAAFTIADRPVTKQGERLLKDYACRRCHVSAEKGNGLAANLDLAQRDSHPEELDLAIEDPVLFMPQFHFYPEQRVALVNAIFQGGLQAGPPPGEIPRVIHFESSGERQERQFDKHCGACHRVLTKRHGGLGSGLIGPNLSGLFSEFYPQNAEKKQDQRWTPENLRKWIKNPREFRPLTQMAPLELKEDELAELMRELRQEEAQGGETQGSSASAGKAAAARRNDRPLQ